jgi:plasmid stabilization system protein ParE
MAYLVRIQPRAERDLADIFATIQAEHSDAAFRWFRGLELALFTLEENPGRCPVTAENKEFRHLLYGHKPHIYRVIYRIIERRKEVEILHVRHRARDRFQADEL